MMEKAKRLKREVQCAKCPWKKLTNPYEIPNGYSKKKHQRLENTISRGFNLHLDELPSMACHESKGGEEDFCLGWLANQLGEGNNLMLRLRMRNYDLSRIKLTGDQHECFEDTLPKKEKRQ